MRVALHFILAMAICCLVGSGCARQSTGTIEGAIVGSSMDTTKTYEIFLMRGVPDSIDNLETVREIDTNTTERYGGAEFSFKLHRSDGTFKIENLPTGDLTLYCMSDGLCGLTVIFDLKRNEHRKGIQVSLDSRPVCDKWRLITDKTLPEEYVNIY